MDFRPTDDQRALQAGVRAFCEQQFPRGALLTEQADLRSWSELDAMGVFSLRLPEDDGGAGLSLADSVLVFEELGRVPVPGPLVATHLAAPLGLDGPVTVLDTREAPLLVEHLGAARHVVLLSDEAVSVVPAADLAATPVGRPVDPLTSLHEVTAVASGRPVGDGMAARRWRAEGALLTAALQVGIAAATTERAVAYAGEREQFGRLIGGFQAVKHLCADMFCRAELARVAVHAAAVTLDDGPSPEADRLVAGAKLLADEAATSNSRSCIQVHGGMGFTWEVDVHLYLKRAWVQAAQFGAAEEHAEALSELL